MGDVSEIQEAKKWIKALLSANAEIAAEIGANIFADRVPGPRPARYIVFNFQGGTDIQGLGTNRLATRPLFQIRVSGEGAPDAAARKVDKRIDDVLQSTSASPSGDYYFSARREQPIDRPEFDPETNRQYFNLGGLFRLWIGRTA